MLGGLSQLDFLRRYWHKQPLLIRRAIPGFAPPLAKAALFRLAGRDDVESRRVSRRGRNWSLESGKGHGFEMNLALIGMALAVLLGGAGAFSIDRFIYAW